MEETSENLVLRHQNAAMRKMSDIHYESMEQTRNIIKYGLLWNKLGLTMAEHSLNYLIKGWSRWSDACMVCQKTVLSTLAPHENRKIDRMVNEIIRST